MRTITVPQDVKADKVELKFAESMRTAIENFPESGKGIANIRKSLKLCEKLMASKPGDKLELDDADYDFLMKAVNDLSWNPAAAKYLVTFFDSLENAENK